MRTSDFLIGAVACLGAQAAFAGDVSLPLTLPMSAGNLFTDALRNGEASAPAPAVRLFDGALQALRQQTGDPGPIHVKARRLVRFTQQARCGRVVFALYQPSSHHAWPSLGGQLNICEDGLPPLRACDDRPKLLVPPTSTCPDKSSPHDTAEVAAAIGAALAGGDITPEEARRRTADRAKAAAPQGKPASGGAS